MEHPKCEEMSKDKKPDKKGVRLVQYLDAGIFPFTVLLSVGFRYKKLYKHLKKTGAKGWAQAIKNDRELVNQNNYLALWRGVTLPKNGITTDYSFIIITDFFDFSDEEMVKLAHEVLHICHFALPKILNIEKEFEAYAYLHSHLMRQCLKHLRPLILK